MVISRWSIDASVVDRTENTMFLSFYGLVEKCPICVSSINQGNASAHAVIMLVLHQGMWNTVLGNTKHDQVIRQNSVASTIANLC
jgi:hypothetical protein